MLFNSYEFIFFFLPVAFIGYFCLGKHSSRSADFWLVAASLAFYSYWDVRYLPLLLLSIGFNFFMGRKIESCRTRTWLVLGIGFNLLLLGYFKYAGFFVDIFNSLSDADLFVPKIVLPLGISFFTFTQTAYLIDAYRGETKHYSLVNYALFVTVFPHLIAGPILNHKDMIPQFSQRANFIIDYGNIARGITLFTMGVFKKVVIADGLSSWVDMVFAHADTVTFIEAWIGAIGYTFQLYFDFSGYSEMAIGLGLLFNLHLPVNFNSPYQSANIIEFWRRWHMTLGLWVKQYLYIPLGGNQHGNLSKMRNLMISMLLVGLWHGAGWNFVLWGGIHGIYLVINHFWRALGFSLPNVIGRLVTFICVVCAWVFFRANNISEAMYILSAMIDMHHVFLPADGWVYTHLSCLSTIGISFVDGGKGNLLWDSNALISNLRWIICLTAAVTFIKNPVNLLYHFRANKKWLVVITLLFLYALLKMDKYTAFLYFQF